MKPDVNSEFLAYYREVVEPLAQKCARDFKTIKAMEDRGEATPEEQAIIDKYHDPLGIWYIGLMIGDIHGAVLRGTSLNLTNSISTVQGNLSEDSTYWENVWDNDFSSEEAKDLRALGKEMQILARKI